MTPVFKLHNVTKIYGDREVLNVADLIIPGGNVHAILGANGSGKTTLMRIMSLLTRNDTGEVEVLGEKVEWSKSQVLRLRRQMTMVTQTSYMFEGTVFYNVAYGLRVRRTPEREIRQTVNECLELLGLSAFGTAQARTLSGGERQKTAIARALAVKPQVLFLDEPTSNVDPHSAIDIEKHIKYINEQFGTTIILVTHNLFQARRLADAVIFMWDGQLIEQGGKEIFTSARDQRTSDFLSGETVF